MGRQSSYAGFAGSQSHRFDASVHFRMWKSLDPEIRAQVEAEYAERLAQASAWRRVTLLRQMRREIEWRLSDRFLGDPSVGDPCLGDSCAANEHS